MKTICIILAAALSAVVYAAFDAFALVDGDENGVNCAVRVVGVSVATTNAGNTVKIEEVRSSLGGVSVTNTLCSISVSGSCTNADLSASARWIDQCARLLCTGSAFTNGVVRIYVER